MNAAIKYYCTRESMVSAVRWIGGDAAYRLLKDWGADVVKSDEENLILQEPERATKVSVGDFIIRIDEDYHKFTPEEMQELYVEATIWSPSTT